MNDISRYIYIVHGNYHITGGHHLIPSTFVSWRPEKYLFLQGSDGGDCHESLLAHVIGNSTSVCRHLHIHTHIHIYTHTYTHTYTYTYTYTYKYTYTHTYAYAYTYTTHIYMVIYNAHIHVHTQSYTYTCAFIHIQRTHIYIIIIKAITINIDNIHQSFPNSSALFACGGGCYPKDWDHRLAFSHLEIKQNYLKPGLP